MDGDIGCNGCCAPLVTDGDIASIDYPPGDPGHDDDVRHWCERCFLDHMDGHPGDPEKQKRCCPENCPTYNATMRV